MPTGRFNRVTYYEIDVDAALSSQDWGRNISRVYWRVLVRRLGGTSGYYSGNNSGNNGGADSNLGGNPDLWSGGGFGYDFRQGVGQTIMFAEGTFEVPHDGSGFGGYWMNAYMNLVNLGYAFAETGWRNLPRIPKRPSEPGTPSFSEILPTSVRVSWGGSGDNRGSSIDGYLLRYWPNAEGSGNYIDHSFQNNTSRLVTGLTPGQQYRFRVYAHNGAADNAGYSNPSGDAIVRTISGIWIKVAGTWRRGIPYLKVAGAWKLASPFLKSAGTWRRTG